MKTRTEYPAGHSVDTNWFAVDRDGNIGLMDATEDAPLPVSVSSSGSSDFDLDEYIDGCFYEMAEIIEPGLFALEVNPDSLKSYLECMKEFPNEQDNDPWVYFNGNLIVTDGTDFRELSIWQNRSERAEFYVINGDYTNVIIDGDELKEEIIFEMKSGRIISVCSFDKYFEAGIEYEGWSFSSIYSKEANSNSLKIKAPVRSSYKYLTPLDISFEDADSFYLSEKAYHHFPNQTDPYPLSELRKKFSHLSKADLEKELIMTIKAIRDDTEGGERPVGILLSEYDVSPFCKDEEGITALEYARQQLADADPDKDEDDDYLSMKAVVHMLELKSKEISGKHDCGNE